MKNIRYITKDISIKKLTNIPKSIQQNLLEISNKLKCDIDYIKPIPIGQFNNFIYDSELYKDINLYNFELFLKPKHYDPNYSNIISIFPTYVDFIQFSVAPDNILRNFLLFKLDISMFINMNNKPSEIFNYINNQEICHKVPDKDKCIGDNIPDVHFNNLVLPVTSHPVEYSYYTLRNILNTYIFLIKYICYLKKKILLHDKHVISCLNYFILYQKIIFREFIINTYHINGTIPTPEQNNTLDNNLWYNNYTNTQYKNIINKLDERISEPEFKNKLNKK